MHSHVKFVISNVQEVLVIFMHHEISQIKQEIT